MATAVDSAATWPPQPRLRLHDRVGVPRSSLFVVGTLVGVSLLFGGFTTITLAGTARQAAGTVEKAD
jgi:hypothetical protein